MKRIITAALILLCFTATHATGRLFEVDVTPTTITTTTTTPNHFYSAAGVKITTPGFSLSQEGIDCQTLSNGFCLFSVSNTTPKVISFEGIGQTVDFILCLNGTGPLSCETHTVSITLFATTQAGNVAESVDHGLSWTLKTAPDGSPVNGMALLPGKTELTQDFYVGTENGNVLESLNAGHTWKSLTQPDGSIVYDIISIRTSASDGTLVAAMGSGKVAISLDRGNNWIFTDEKPDGSPVYGVSLDPKNTRTSDCETTIINSNACNLYVATANGNVLRTTNGGKTWTSSQPMPGIAVFDVSASTNGTVYAGLENGKTKVSFDSGQSWGLEGSPNSSAVNGLLALHHAHSYAATNSGRIMYSTNFGKNWTALPEAPDTSSSSSRSTPALAKIYSPSLKITSIANVKDGE